jgi:acyl-CoA thioesterase-1
MSVFKFQQLRVMLISGLMLFLLAGCDEPSVPPAAAGDSTPGKTSPPVKDNSFTILALGDSLTEGLGVAADGTYPAILQQALHEAGYPQIKVVNSGFSGETSSGLKNRVDWVLQLKPQLTILTIGANDAMRGLPLELTRDNISTTIERIEAAGSQVILGGMQIYDNLGREYVNGFKDLYPQLATEHEVPLIPFFLEHVAGNPDLNQADLIHPTRAGYEIIVERNVLPAVLPELDKMIQPESP